MPVRVQPPKRTEVKPQPWNVTPSRVVPEWRWAWEKAVFQTYFWENGGSSADASHGYTMSLADGSADWKTLPSGVAMDMPVPETAWKLDQTRGVPNGSSGDELTAEVLVEYRGDHTVNPVTLMVVQDEWWFTIESDGEVIIRTFGGNIENSGPIISQGAVYHLVLSWKAGTEATVYVDGEKTGPASISDTSSDTGNPLWVGSRDTDGDGNADGNSIDAAFSKVALYDTILTDSEVRKLARAPFGPFRRQRIRYVGGPAAGAQILTESLTDTTAADDTVSLAGLVIESLTDVNVVVDSVSESEILAELLADSGVTTDTLGFQLTNTDALTDTARITDSLTETAVMAEAPSDGVAVLDNISDTATLSELLADSSVVTDSLSESLTGLIQETLTDSATATDSVDSVGLLVETLDASLPVADALTETVSAAGVITETLTDQLPASDRLSLTQTLTEALTESLRVADIQDDTTIYVVAITDSAGLSDTASVGGLITYTLLDDRGVEIVDQRFGVEVTDEGFDVEPLDDSKGVS